MGTFSGTKRLLARFCLLALGAALAAGCGGGRARSSVASQAHSTHVVVDPDHDDQTFEEYGHPASAAANSAIRAILRDYYAIAVAGDGAKACSMLVSGFARSIPTDFGRPPGPPALRGNTCPVVMSKLFAQQHKLLVAEAPNMKITRVRVQGSQALVFLAFPTTPEPRDMGLEHEAGTWRLTGMIDTSLP